MRVVARACFAGTLVLGLGGFILSFAALRELAVMVGIPEHLAWIWPLLVDGLIVEATLAVVVLAGTDVRKRGYAWVLLVAGALVSLIGNGAHAVLAGAGGAGALVAAVPPLILVASTHLTVVLGRAGTAGHASRQEVVEDIGEVFEPAHSALALAESESEKQLSEPPEPGEDRDNSSRAGAAGSEIDTAAVELSDSDRELLVVAQRCHIRGVDVTARELMEKLSVSDSTARRRLRRLSELREAGYQVALESVS